MSRNPGNSVGQFLATLRAIEKQQPSRNGLREFNALHVGPAERSVYRSGMQANLSVPAGVLEALAQDGQIRWTKRGIGVDSFVLAASE